MAFRSPSALTLVLVGTFLILQSIPFSHAAGKDNPDGRASITADGPFCLWNVDDGTGVDTYDAQRNGRYIITLTTPTECKINDAYPATVGIVVKNGNSFNSRVTAFATSTAGEYKAYYTLPAASCQTSPITYVCANGEDYFALSPKASFAGKQVHFRSSSFAATCGAPVSTTGSGSCTSGIHSFAADIMV